MGKAIQHELPRYAADDDTERRSRVQKILAELEEVEDDDDVDPSVARPWLAQDTLETTLFTVVGKISPQTFDLQTRSAHSRWPSAISAAENARPNKNPKFASWSRSAGKTWCN